MQFKVCGSLCVVTTVNGYWFLQISLKWNEPRDFHFEMSENELYSETTGTVIKPKNIKAEFFSLLGRDFFLKKQEGCYLRIRSTKCHNSEKRTFNLIWINGLFWCLRYSSQLLYGNLSHYWDLKFILDHGNSSFYQNNLSYVSYWYWWYAISVGLPAVVACK